MQKGIWCQQIRDDGSQESVSCQQQQKIDVAEKSISCRQKQDDDASKKYFVRKKIFNFFRNDAP